MERVLVLCDDLWHPAEVIEMGLAARKDDRFVFDVIKTAKDILTPEYIARYRLIVCCKSNSVIAANNEPWFEEGVTEVGPAEFEAYIRNGGGFLAVHAGLSFTEARNRAYVDLVGSAFRGHPPRCSTHFTVTDPTHPVARAVADFDVRDEHYAIELLCDDAQVFLTSTSPAGGTQPAGYTRTMGRGRLCALTAGHTLAAWEHPQFQQLFTNAALWCLGQEA